MRGELIERRWEYDPALYAPPRYRRACRYDAFIPTSLAGTLPPIEPAVAGAVSDAETAIHALNAFAQPALPPLARLLLRTESIASSKVEGMQVDGRALARAEVRAEGGREPGREVAEVLANIDAMQLAIEEAAAEDAFRVDLIVSIHSALMARSTNSSVAGRVRSDQNWIGGNDYNPCGADFVPPPPTEVPRLMHDLVSFCADDTFPPLVQAAIAHAQFETIHPFADGNGRTGRALVQVLLRRRGLAPRYVPPISVVLASERDRYIAGLTAFRNGRENEWIELFAAVSARAAILATDYLQQVAVLQERWQEQLRVESDPRADSAAWKVIEALPAYPIVTIGVAVAATGRTRPAIAQAIQQLVAAGVLHPVTQGRRHRAWEAVGLLDLLGELEAGRAPRV